MPRGGLFGVRPVGAVTVVETPVSQSYARKARIAFLGVAGVAGVSAAAVFAVFANPVVAVMLGVIAGVVCGFVVAVLVLAWPVLRVLWWWSIEIAVFGLVVLVPAWLARVTGYPLVVLLGMLAVAGVLVGVGPVRRWLWAWSWCLVVRHRLRLCFAEFLRTGSRGRPGGLPLLLWARPTPAGERVWLWLRPGLDLAELESRIGKLAVACWASGARVVGASARYAALVRVDVARRDPLTAEVASPLAGLVPPQRHGDGDGDVSNVPVSPGLPPLGLDLADIPEPTPEPRGGRR